MLDFACSHFGCISYFTLRVRIANYPHTVPAMEAAQCLVSVLTHLCRGLPADITPNQQTTTGANLRMINPLGSRIIEEIGVHSVQWLRQYH